MRDLSGGTPRWKRLPHARREAILEAAIAIFGRSGVESSNMEEIAAHAGVSKGSVYRYFPDKHQLFRESVFAVLSSLATDFKLRSHDDPEDYLRALWRALNSARFRTVYRLATTTNQFPEVRDRLDSTIKSSFMEPFAFLLSQVGGEMPDHHLVTTEKARFAFATLLGLALMESDPAAAPSSTIGFLLRACAVDAPAPQADGF